MSDEKHSLRAQSTAPCVELESSSMLMWLGSPTFESTSTVKNLRTNSNASSVSRIRAAELQPGAVDSRKARRARLCDVELTLWLEIWFKKPGICERWDGS